jgi:helix-turn-helix protein
MNKLSSSERARILQLLCEGMSIRAIERTTGASKHTITRLLNDAGRALGAVQDRMFRDLKTRRVQVDEIWSFTYAKQRNVGAAKSAPDWAGDTWTWTAIDADSKLVMSWLVGGRDSGYAMAFMDDLATRLANRVQLTSDGHKAYLRAVEEAFGADIDYAVLEKIYKTDPAIPAGRYSPASLHRGQEAPRRRRPRSAPSLNVLRRAPEPYDADAHAPLHAPDERLFQEGREPRQRGRASLRLLQPRQNPQDPAHDACDGRWSDRQAVGDVRSGRRA